MKVEVKKSSSAPHRSMEINSLSAVEIGRLVSSGELRAEQVVNACYERIAQLDDSIHAWVSLDIDYALEQALAIDQRVQKGEQPGSLAGVPMGVKDVINTVVFPTKMGSPIWEKHYAGNDARVVAHLKWEGALVAGKTVTAEFAVHEPGPTRNPHDLGKTPGTSSSGSAAAVAAAMVPLALGTQTAGSLIRPASFCGVYAFKPTFGWLPRTGILKTTDTLDQIGFFTRYATDMRQVFEAGRVKGRDHVLKEEKYAQFPDKDSWRIGIARTHLWQQAPQYAQDALLRYAGSLSGKRMEVMEVDLPPAFEQAHEIHGRIYDSDLSYYFKREMNVDPASLSKQLRVIINQGVVVSPDSYRAALQQQTALIALFDDFMARNNLDILISLSSNGEAPVIEPIPFRDPCVLYTLCGAPTVNLPVFQGPNGLPFGAQVVGRKYADRVLLSFVEHLAREGELKPSVVAQPE